MNTITNDYPKKNNEVKEQNTITNSQYPGLVVELPSKGLLYPENHPLSSGRVEIKYMTAKEEDILTTESYIKSGVVLDKLFQSLLLTKFNYEDLLLCDKEAIMIASRIYGYGKDYNAEITTPSGQKKKITVDLESLEHKELKEEIVQSKGENIFTLTLPFSKDVIEFKLLTVGDETIVNEKIKKAKSAGRSVSITATLSTMIVSVNGNNDKKFIEMYVNNDFRVQDSKALRNYIKEIQPGINLEIECMDEDTEEFFRSNVTFGLDFFWPDIKS